ncbi:MAG: helix-turn-helix domain-containing protein, partial [Solirubrobacterales bacterium]|nr:helix-turn-helix domain-containing protein [Solirubrobacterales bacterium]
MSRPPSLQHIADKAGVSVATASLALRDKGRISQDTRRRIKQLAEECGY